MEEKCGKDKRKSSPTAGVMIWGDQNKDGKTKSRSRGTGLDGLKPQQFMIMMVMVVKYLLFKFCMGKYLICISLFPTTRHVFKLRSGQPLKITHKR